MDRIFPHSTLFQCPHDDETATSAADVPPVTAVSNDRSGHSLRATCIKVSESMPRDYWPTTRYVLQSDK